MEIHNPFNDDLIVYPVSPYTLQNDHLASKVRDENLACKVQHYKELKLKLEQMERDLVMLLKERNLELKDYGLCNKFDGSIQRQR